MEKKSNNVKLGGSRFNDTAVRYALRWNDFCNERVLRTIFDGTRKANKWAKENAPTELGVEDMAEYCAFIKGGRTMRAYWGCPNIALCTRRAHYNSFVADMERAIGKKATKAFKDKNPFESFVK